MKNKFLGDLPLDCRQWFYYPIPININKDGNGPCSKEEYDRTIYEVWDMFYDSFGSYENMYDAINKALELNLQQNKNEDHLYNNKFYKEMT